MASDPVSAEEFAGILADAEYKQVIEGNPPVVRFLSNEKEIARIETRPGTHALYFVESNVSSDL